MKSIVRFFISVLMILSISILASAQETIPAPPEPNKPSDFLMGPWVAENIIYNRGVEIHTAFHFSQFQMRLTGTCVFPPPNATTLSASLNARINFDGNDLYINETKNSYSDDGYRYCQVYVQPTRWQFYFNGVGKAVLIASVPYGAQFTLVRPNSIQ